MSLDFFAGAVVGQIYFWLGLALYKQDRIAGILCVFAGFFGILSICGI
ncbi:MAG: hypothetical protein ACTSWK_17660 [Promethearchaeota archaeon]